jgi:uncharacterized protein (DUF2249 family)
LISIKAVGRTAPYLARIMSKQEILLDVREEIRQGSKPCGLITRAVETLQPGQSLRLIAPFEPVPLFDLLGSQGYGHQATALPGGDWEVLFSRDLAVEAAKPRQAEHAGCGCSRSTEEEVMDVDARGLEPPQPMVKILEALVRLPVGAELRARTDRRPVHLLPQLDLRGFKGESSEQPDGSFITLVARK